MQAKSSFFKKMIVGAAIMACVPISAEIVHDLDNAKPLKCTFSSTQHNRILVENGAIESIFCLNPNVQGSVDSDSGQAFIYTSTDNPNISPFTVTIITNKGLTQDLEITLADRPSEVVVLRDPQDEEIEYIELESKHVAKEDRIVKVVQQLFKGKVPPGYSSKSVKIEKRKGSILQGVKYKIIGLLENSSESIKVLKIYNISSSNQIVLEKDLKTLGDQWFFIQKANLSPRESTIAIVCQKRLRGHHG